MLQLRPHFDLAASYTAAFARWSQDRPATAELALVANQLATFLHTTACHAAAEPLMRRALAIFTISLGHTHPSTLTVRRNYERLLQTMGMSPPEIRRRLNELLAEYGMSLG